MKCVPPETLGRAVFVKAGVSFPVLSTPEGDVFVCCRCGQAVSVDENGFALAADIPHREGCPLSKAVDIGDRPLVLTRE
jgi:hypothetical protein